MRSQLIPCLLTLLLTGGAGKTRVHTLANDGVLIHIKTGANLTVHVNLTTAGAVSNSGALTVTSNITNNGTYISMAAGTLNLSGSTVQVPDGTAAINAQNVTVNSAGRIVLNTQLNVDGAMTFANRIATATSSAPVSFTANGTGGTPTDASPTDGYVQKNSIGAFPFPVGIKLAAGTAMTAHYYTTDAGSATFGTRGSSPTPLLYYNKKKYRDIIPSGVANGTVTIYYDGYSNAGISNTADLRVTHKTGSLWLSEGGTVTGTTSAGSVASGSVGTWLTFTSGSNSNAKPLALTTLIAEGTPNCILWMAFGKRNRNLFALNKQYQ